MLQEILHLDLYKLYLVCQILVLNLDLVIHLHTIIFDHVFAVKNLQVQPEWSLFMVVLVHLGLLDES